MKSLLQRALIIVAAMVGSGLVLVVLITAAANLTVYGSSPADFLPANQTLLVLHNPQEKDLERWKHHFPVLKDITYKKNISVAVISLRKNIEAAVSFSIELEESPNAIGPYTVVSTDARVFPLLGKQDSPLSKKEDYSTLALRRIDSDRWTYSTKHALNEHNQLIDRLLRAITFSTEHAIGISGGRVVDLEHRKETTSLAQAPLHIASVDNAFVILSFAGGKDAWMRLLESMSTEDAIVTEGIARAAIANLGSDVSFVSDLLPLITEPGTLQLFNDNNILLEGSMQHSTALHALLDRVHKAYANTLPSLRVTKRVLDKRFSSVDIRNDPSMILEDQTRHAGWTLRSTKHEEREQGLFSATQGNKYIISTNEDAIRTALSKKRTLNLPRLERKGTLFLGGVVQLSHLQHLLAGLNPSQSHFFATTQTGTLLFSSVQTGDIRHLLLQTENTDLLLDSLL